MEVSTRVNGIMINMRVKESANMPTEVSTKGSLKMEKQMDMEYIQVLEVWFSKEIGLMTYSKAKANSM